jgi:hypothetical protein
VILKKHFVRVCGQNRRKYELQEAGNYEKDKVGGEMVAWSAVFTWRNKMAGCRNEVVRFPFRNKTEVFPLQFEVITAVVMGYNAL